MNTLIPAHRVVIFVPESIAKDFADTVTESLPPIYGAL